jgi:glycosyltransferase involved in cell wall biosynthesis
LTCGRLIESKNVHLAIEALAHLDDGFLLYVVGDGPARPELEEHTHRLQLHDRVRFLGHVDNETLYRWLRTATVYVSMSRQEAFGITLAEALAAGAAVVASDIPTHLEVVAAAGAEQATLVPLDLSPGALAQTIRDMAAHERTESAQTSLMSWDTVAARTMAVYDEVFAE